MRGTKCDKRGVNCFARHFSFFLLMSTLLTSVQADFVAYNDCAWTANSGQNPAANDITGNFTTNSPLALLNGYLKDSTSATQVAVTVTFNTSQAVGLNFLDRTFGPPTGSDAATWFSGKIGTNCAVNWTSGTVTMTLNGMNPASRYNIVLWSTRGGDTTAYSNRLSDITISGADLFTNRSSSGTQWFTNSMANDRTRVRAALASGPVVRYDGINPGTDGAVAFAIKAGADMRWGPTWGSTNGYLNGFMVQEYDAAGVVAGTTSSVYWRGITAPPGGESSWRARVYDASAWTSGDAPYRYGDGSGGTTLTDMQNNFSTLYIRIPFLVTHAAAVQELTLNMDFDDAFIAWVAGGQVAASSNAPASPLFSSLSTRDHESSMGVGGSAAEVHHIVGASLVTGTNYLCIQGFNVSTGSSDLVMNPRLEVVYGSASQASTATWQRAQVTGTMNANSCMLYLYTSNSTAPIHVDDLFMCPGTTPETGGNLVLNPGFESGTNDWDIVGSFVGTSLPLTTFKRGGSSSLRLQASAPVTGGGGSHSVKQMVTGLTSGAVHTLSFWYYATNAIDFVARYSGHPAMAALVQLADQGTKSSTSVVFEITAAQKPGVSNTCRLTVNGTAGRIYRVMRRDSMASGTWQQSGIQTSLVGTLSVDVSLASKSGYFQFVETAWALPTIDNASGASGIASNRATLNGNLLATGALPTSVYVCWDTLDRGTVSTGDWGHVETVGVRASGAFSNVVSGLGVGASYVYRCYAANAVGTVFASSASSFSTISLSLPILTSPTVTSVGSGSATLGATVTSVGNDSLGSRGTCWGTSSSPTGNALAQGSTNAGAFTQSRTGFSGGTRHYFRGYAVNSSGTAYSPEGSFWTEPGGPSSLSFYAIGQTAMTLSWSTNGSVAMGSLVLVQDAADPSTLPADATTYTAHTTYGSGSGLGGGYVVKVGAGTTVTVTGLTAGHTYYVRVYTYAGSGSEINFQQDGPATGSQVTAPGAPVAPSGLTATPASSSQINLTWTDNANNETGFKLERKTGSGGTYSQIATLNSNLTSYANSGLNAGSQYYYRLRANNSGGDSSYSAEANATTLAAGSLVPAILSEGYDDIMKIQITGTPGNWLISDLCTRQPQSGYEWWYFVGNKIIKTSTPLSNEPWNGNQPGRVLKMGGKLGLDTFNRWAFDGGWYYDPDAGMFFERADCGAVTTFMFK